MIVTLTTLPTAGGAAAFANVTPAGVTLLEELPVVSTGPAVVQTGAAFTVLPNDFPMAGDLLVTNSVAPTAPALGLSRIYVDNALKALSCINDAGQIFNLTGPPWPLSSLPVDSVTSALEFVIDGGGSALLINTLSPYLIVPTSCTLTGVKLLADVSGSITVDVWTCTYANFNPGTHPVVADSITASAVPAIASTYKYSDTTLTGWTTTIPAGNIIVCNVKVAATSITRVTVALTLLKT